MSKGTKGDRKMEKNTLIEMIENRTPRSYWGKGVKAYALDLLYDLEQDDLPESEKLLEKTFLNGASDWNEYSDGGCALIYNGDIAERLCTPSQLKRKKGGELPPNSRENWLDVQARALNQAYHIIRRAIRKHGKDI